MALILRVGGDCLGWREGVRPGSRGPNRVSRLDYSSQAPPHILVLHHKTKQEEARAMRREVIQEWAGQDRTFQGWQFDTSGTMCFIDGNVSRNGGYCSQAELLLLFRLFVYF